MGDGVKTSNDGIIEIVATDNGNENGGSATSTSTTDSRTDSRTDTNGGTNGGIDGNGGRTDTEKTIVSELAILTDEERKQYNVADETEKKRLLRNAKRRERYAKQKADNGQSVKPRKVNKKTSKQKDDTDRTQINAVIGGISTAIASRPNCQHWQLSEQEIDTITKPLCEMLKESEVFEKVSEHSNEIALVTACFTVFAPRILTTVMIEKEKRKNEPRPTVTNKKTEDKKLDKRNDKGTTDNNANNGSSGGWFGDALY
jgi:hypothetical protein